MDPRHDPAEADPFTPFAVLACFFAGANFLIFPLAASSVPRGTELISLLAAAILGAQLSLVASWGVFGSAPFLTRLGKCAALGFVSYLCLLLGCSIVMSETGMTFVEFAELMFALLAGLPIVFFCVQLPLWILRLWLGWEVAGAESESSGSYGRPILIKDLVLATAAVSVALALVRLVPTLTERVLGDEYLIVVATSAAGAAAVSLVTLPPLIFAILASRQLAFAALGVAAWTVLFDAVCLTAITLLSGSIPTADVIFYFTLMAMVYAGIVATGLLLTRRLGYRLRWRALRRPVRGKAGSVQRLT